MIPHLTTLTDIIRTGAERFPDRIALESSTVPHALTYRQLWETIRTGWGFSPEKDQQIGGLLMWVPMCFIYLGAIFAQIPRWFGEAPAASPATQRF